MRSGQGQAWSDLALGLSGCGGRPKGDASWRGDRVGRICQRRTFVPEVAARPVEVMAEVMTGNQQCRCHQMCCSSSGSIDGEAVVEIGGRSLLGGSMYLLLIRWYPAHVSPIRIPR